MYNDNKSDFNHGKIERLYRFFKKELLNDPAVTLVSITNASPLLEFWMVLMHYTEDGTEKEYTPAHFPGDENFVSALGINIREGRNFSGNITTFL